MDSPHKTSANYQPNDIEALEADYLYIQPSQLLNAGNGVYTVIDIYKDEIIAQFEGEILTNTESKTRADQGLDVYFINMVDGTTMDSMNTDCFAKFANDAKGFNGSLYLNNAKIGLDDNGNVCLIATKKILSYNEIFCSYGQKYWLNRK